MGYDVFISYAQDGDARGAEAVRNALIRFAKPWWRRRSLTVFLDQSVLAANPGIWSSISTALDESEWLILLASPESAQSEWVNREISHWLERRGTERLIVAVTAGHCRWDEALGGFDESSDAIPTSLRGVHLEEPRYVDLSSARTEPKLDLQNARFREQIAEIAAPIHGQTKDDLEGVDLREHRRFKRSMIAIFTALLVLSTISVVAAIAAVRFAQQSSARTADAEFAQLVDEARNLRTSNLTLAMLLAVQAVHTRSNSQSDGALLATLTEDDRFDAQVVGHDPTSGFTSLCLIRNGTMAIAGMERGGIAVFDLRRGIQVGDVLHFGPVPSSATSVACSSASPTDLAFDRAGYWVTLEVGRAIAVRQLHHYNGLYSMAVSPDGGTLAASDGEGHLVLAPAVGKFLPRSVSGGDLGRNGPNLVFSPDGGMLAAVSSSASVLWNVATLHEVLQINGPSLSAISATPRTPLLRQTVDQGEVAFSPDGRLLAISADSLLRLISMPTGQQMWSIPTAWYGGSSLEFDSAGQLLVNLASGQVQQINVANGASIGEPIAPTGGISVHFALVGTRLVACSDSSPVLSVFDLAGNGPIVRAVPVSDPFQLVEYDPSGRSLLLLLPSQSTSLFDVTRAFDERTSSLGPTLPGLIQPRFVEPETVAGLQENLTVGVFSANSAQLVRPPTAVSFFHATNAQFDPITNQIALANTDGTIDLYGDGNGSRTLPWARVPSAYPILSSGGFASDGAIAVFDSSAQRVWVLNASGHIILRKATDVAMAALTSNGRELAVLHDLQVDVFSMATDRLLGSVAAPPGSTDLEFSQDGKRMLVFGETQGLVVDLNDFQPLGDPFPSTGYLALRPDGNELATVSNGSVLLWSLKPTNWESAACQAAGRNLTQKEWHQYLPDGGPHQRTCPQWS